MSYLINAVVVDGGIPRTITIGEKRHEASDPILKSGVGLSGAFLMGYLAHPLSTHIIRFDGNDLSDAEIIDYCRKMVSELHDDCAISPTYVIDFGDKETRITEPQGAGILYKAECFNACGGYNESMDYQADLDFYIRFALLGQHNIKLSKTVTYSWVSGRSGEYNENIFEARRRILSSHHLNHNAAHHFGAYAYK